MGNSKGRAVYEANLPNDYRRPTSDQAMEAFIRQKYEKKKYIAAEWTNPKPPDFPANWDTAGTAAQEIKKPEFKKLNIPSNKPSPYQLSCTCGYSIICSRMCLRSLAGWIECLSIDQ